MMDQDDDGMKTLADDVAENSYRHGYTQVYPASGGVYHLTPESASIIHAAQNLKEAYVFVTDLDGARHRLRIDDIEDVVEATPETMAKNLAHWEWRWEREREMRRERKSGKSWE